MSTPVEKPSVSEEHTQESTVSKEPTTTNNETNVVASVDKTTGSEKTTDTEIKS